MKHFNENSTIEALDLSGSTIDKERASYVANILKTNKNLKSLKLAQASFQPGAIELITQAIGESKTLEHLDLSNNTFQIAELQNLVAALTPNVTLKSLALVACSTPNDETLQTNNEANKIIGNLLQHNKSLKAFDYGNNKLSTGFFEGLIQNHTLSFLNIEGATYDPSADVTEINDSIFKFIKNNSKLVYIDFSFPSDEYPESSGKYIQPELKRVYSNAETLLYAPYLNMVINIDSNYIAFNNNCENISPNDSIKLGYMARFYEQLVLLNQLKNFYPTCYNNIIKTLDETKAKHYTERSIGENLVNTIKLAENNLNRNFTYNDITDTWELKIPADTTNIKLANQELNHQQFKDIAKVLRTKNNITALDVSKNPMSSSEIKLVTHALAKNSKNSKLKNINLSDTIISSLTVEDGKNIAKAITANKKLEEFTFSTYHNIDNNIHNYAFEAITNAICTLKHINKLQFFSCGLSSDKMDGIIKILQSSKSLTQLYIHYNRISNQYARRLFDALNPNSALNSNNTLKFNDNLLFIDFTESICNSSGLKYPIDIFLRMIANNKSLVNIQHTIPDALLKSDRNLTEAYKKNFTILITSSTQIGIINECIKRNIQTFNNNMFSWKNLSNAEVKIFYNQLKYIKLIKDKGYRGIPEGLLTEHLDEIIEFVAKKIKSIASAEASLAPYIGSAAHIAPSASADLAPVVHISPNAYVGLGASHAASVTNTTNNSNPIYNIR